MSSESLLVQLPWKWSCKDQYYKGHLILLKVQWSTDSDPYNNLLTSLNIVRHVVLSITCLSLVCFDTSDQRKIWYNLKSWIIQTGSRRKIKVATCNFSLKYWLLRFVYSLMNKAFLSLFIRCLLISISITRLHESHLVDWYNSKSLWPQILLIVKLNLNNCKLSKYLHQTKHSNIILVSCDRAYYKWGCLVLLSPNPV